MNTTLSPSELHQLLESDEQLMNLLRLINKVIPHPWCVFGGQVRNIVWDYSTDNPASHLSRDVDIGIFSSDDASLETLLGNALREIDSDHEWDIENFAFSHIENQDDAYSSLEDGLSKQLMTVMSVGATLSSEGRLLLLAPLGIEDLVNLTVRPTPIIYRHPERFRLIEETIVAKEWQQKWPELKIIL